MSPTHIVSLKKFMIFNSNEGQSESSEGDKLLYHWADSTIHGGHKVDLREQIDDVCLCDASVTISNRLTCDLSRIHDRFTTGQRNVRPPESSANTSTTREPSDNSFKPNENGRSLVLNFANTLVVVIQVELDPPIWIAMHVVSMIPPSIESASIAMSSSHAANSQEGSGELVQYADPGSISTKIIERIANNIYARFRLLNGSFRMSTYQEGDTQTSSRAAIDKMRTICTNYFDIALPQIHLNSIMTNITSIYNYINYLDISPIALMRVNCFINHLISIDASKIQHSIVIFNDKLLWSSLDAYNTRLVYNYLISVLIRDALQEELSKEVNRVRRIAEARPIYLTEQFDSDEESSEVTNPLQGSIHDHRGHLRQTTNMKLLYLSVFRSSNDMTLGLFLNVEKAGELLQRCQQVLTKDSRFGVIPLASLAQSIGHTFIKTATSSSGPAKVSTSASVKPSDQLTAGLLRRPMALPNDSTLKCLTSPDSKFVVMDRMDSSVTCPMQVYLSNSSNSSSSKDSGHKFVQLLPSGGSGKHSRLIKWLVELEPELAEMSNLSESRVEEFLGKTLNDSWIMVTNSRYRTIYSMNKVKNSGLNEAQQCAIQMKSILFGNHL